MKDALENGTHLG